MAFEVPARDPCPFCDNVAGHVTTGGVTCAPVFEDEITFAFVAPQPIQPGSLLVIPKRHAATILDVTDDETAAIMRTVRKLSFALIQTLDPLGLNIFQNNGRAANQAVGHFHVHVVPRYANDGGTFGDPSPVTPLAERLAMADRIKRNLLN